MDYSSDPWNRPNKSCPRCITSIGDTLVIAVRSLSSARGLALIALVIVLIAGVVNSVATSVQAQDNCQDIQRIDGRLSNVFKQTKEDLVSGSRDLDLQTLYGYNQRKLPNGKSVPHWKYIKITTINQYTSLIKEFKEEKCPLPILGLHHRS